MSQTPNRKQRRTYLKAAGMLKAKNELTFKEWFQYVAENQKKGNEIHAKNVDFFEKQVYEQLQEKENSMVKFWKETGHDQIQIDKFLDSWYKVVFRNRDKKAKLSEA
jgi:hypothetical protein